MDECKHGAIPESISLFLFLLPLTPTASVGGMFWLRRGCFQGSRQTVKIQQANRKSASGEFEKRVSVKKVVVSGDAKACGKRLSQVVTSGSEAENPGGNPPVCSQTAWGNREQFKSAPGLSHLLNRLWKTDLKVPPRFRGISLFFSLSFPLIFKRVIHNPTGLSTTCEKAEENNRQYGRDA